MYLLSLEIRAVHAKHCGVLDEIGVSWSDGSAELRQLSVISLIYSYECVCAPQKCVWMRTHVRKSRVMSLCISQICEKIRVFIVVKYRIEDGTLQCSITQNKQKAALVTKI